MQHTRSLWYVHQLICIEIFLQNNSTLLIDYKQDEEIQFLKEALATFLLDIILIIWLVIWVFILSIHCYNQDIFINLFKFNFVYLFLLFYKGFVCFSVLGQYSPIGLSDLHLYSHLYKHNHCHHTLKIYEILLLNKTQLSPLQILSFQP